VGLKLGSIKLFWTKDYKRFFIGVPKRDNNKNVTDLKYHVEITEEIENLMILTQNGKVKEIDGKYYRVTVDEMTTEEIEQYKSLKGEKNKESSRRFEKFMQRFGQYGRFGGSLPKNFFSPVQLKDIHKGK